MMADQAIRFTLVQPFLYPHEALDLVLGGDIAFILCIAIISPPSPPPSASTSPTAPFTSASATPLIDFLPAEASICNPHIADNTLVYNSDDNIPIPMLEPVRGLVHTRRRWVVRHALQQTIQLLQCRKGVLSGVHDRNAKIRRSRRRFLECRIRFPDVETRSDSSWPASSCCTRWRSFLATGGCGLRRKCRVMVRYDR